MKLSRPSLNKMALIACALVSFIFLSGCATSDVEVLENKSDPFPIPANCSLWFDGCNRCIVENGEIKGCTKMACSLGRKLASTCLEYYDDKTK